MLRHILPVCFLLAAVFGSGTTHPQQCSLTAHPVCDNAKVASMVQYREDDRVADGVLTTNQGVKIADDQNSLKAGPRGPTLLEDFIMREKITHFDHERIPERVVHARGAAAHGFFQVYQSLENITKAKFLIDCYATTPVFVRFSTVAGSRGSPDTVRDIRGFAVKFYTSEGNFDIVGNNAPVFFVQDAMKFPDFVHSVKPEPQNEIPQASSAHDSLYDFVTRQSETMHALMWAMSDRGLPRSYSMMEGFGVHTFRLINARGESRFVKFHWKPKLGVHSLIFDEAAKISGKDPDFHRRQLWEDIEAGYFPEWELGLQIIEEADAYKFDFDLLDPTKLIPEELVPVMRVGKLVLNRNPDNYFAETEQVAFDIGNVVPGIDFSNDPLMQGRIFSYLDTQLSRLGGVNFNEIPINRPICPFRNNQRDGFHRETINIAKTNYDVNSLNNGLPKEAGPVDGYTTHAEPLYGAKIRSRSESFADHFSQATLFYKSLSIPEQDHIVGAFSLELSKLSYQVLRERMLDHLQNVDYDLAIRVANNLNMPLPPKANNYYPKQVIPSPALSEANTVKSTIYSRKIAILVSDGVDGNAVAMMKSALRAQGAYVVIVAPRIGNVMVSKGPAVIADATIAGSPSILYDAVFVAGGADNDLMMRNGGAVHYLYETYVYYKPIAASGSGVSFLSGIGLISANSYGALPEGVIASDTDYLSKVFIDQFIHNIAQHRYYNRQEISSVPA